MNMINPAKKVAPSRTTGNDLRSDDVVAKYVVRSNDTIEKAADAIAIGQSIGNPNVRLKGETDEMWAEFGCQVRDIRESADGAFEVDVGYPVGNFSPKSLVHMLTVVMGGQMDIDIIKECRLIDLDLPPKILAQYEGPKFGIKGIRDHLGAYNRPLIGGIVKPKTGLTVQMLVDVCRQMADGGVDFIKEDEILGTIDICPFDERVEKVGRALESYKVIFAPAVNSPIEELPDRVAALKRGKCKAFHYNVWGGFDTFRYMSQMSDLFAFYQKSGDKVMTSGAFSVDFNVWCKLIRLAGADFTHAGMMGGYLDEPAAVMHERMAVLRGPMAHLKGVIPSLSCGATPGTVDYLRENLGVDIMVSAGGCLHGHPQGTYAGAKAFRDAAEGRSSPEFDAAIAKWGRK
jgi:ribulose-bisphosphate carboxylase large chain